MNSKDKYTLNNIKNSQLNFAHDNSVIDAKYINNQVGTKEEKLLEAIQKLLVELPNSNELDDDTKYLLTGIATSVQNDLQNEKVSSSHLQRLKQYTSKTMDLISKGSHIYPFISAIKDSIDLFKIL